MRADEVVVGTAGHIDHGKTSLVRALTGTDTDRLPEEKRRGITIDLGFAHMDLATPQGLPLRVSFVDVPGHHAFVRNMLAGAGGIDCALLVVSAEEGIRPQTEEHLGICELLGVRRGLAVVTKADAVAHERLADRCREVRDFLQGSFLHGAPVLAASAFTGQGLPELKQGLAEMAAAVPARDRGGLPRLPVDRVFAMRGFGTVVTGTLQSGVIRRGDMLVCEPSGRRARVRAVQRHGRAAEEAEAGSRVALNLTGIETGEIGRGQTLVAAGGARAVERLDAEIRMLPGASPLKHGAEVRLHAFTAEVGARVLLYEGAALAPGATGLAGLRLNGPVVLLPGDRFVLRQPSPATTVGGGRVLDAHPILRQRKGERRAWLESLRAAPPAEALHLRAERRGRSGIGIEQLAAELGWAQERVEAALKDAPGVVRTGHLLLAGAAFAEVMRVIAEQAGAAAGRDASGAGLKRSELRSRTALAEAVFEAALERLVLEGRLAIAGELVRPFAARTPVGDRRSMEAVAEEYRAGALNPPLLRDVGNRLRMAEPELRRVMTLLLREKTLVKVGSEDWYVHREALDHLRERIVALKGQSLDVARFKQLTGLSRKMAIPLLEYLDRQFVTRRTGETRVVL
jgi:selenocysteine-specific elongation factor